jgi:hypothetical protein
MRALPVLGALAAFTLVTARVLLQSTMSAARADAEAAPSPGPEPGPPPTQPLEEGASYLRRFLDPIVIVTSIAAIASATFAYQTNAINQHQSELLDRQVAIEESLALPVFTVTMTIDTDGDGEPVSGWLAIDNRGGMANDLVIDVIPFSSFWWQGNAAGSERESIEGDEVPVIGMFDEYSSSSPSHMLPGQSNVLGYEGNVAAYRDATGRIADHLMHQPVPLVDLDQSLEIIVGFHYVDYMGTERSDYYYADLNSDGEIYPHGQFLRLGSDLGDEITADYYAKFNDRFALRLDAGSEPPDDELIRQVAQRIHDNSAVSEDPTATPVAVSERRPTRRT